MSPSTRCSRPALAALLAACACLLATRAVQADDARSFPTPAGTFVRRRAADATTLELPGGATVVRLRDQDGLEAGLRVARRGPDGRPVTLLEIGHLRADGRLARTRRDGHETTFLHDDDGLLSGVVDPFDARTWVEHRGGLRVAFERDGEAEVWTRGADGRLVAAGERRVLHDAAGRVVEVVGPPGDVEPTWRVRYLRDARGDLRSLERTERDGPASTRPARSGPVVERLDGGRARRWLRLPGEPAPVAYEEDGAWTFLAADARGTVVAYLDAAGALVAEAELSPWGEPTTRPGDRPIVWRGGRVVDAAHLAWLGGRAYSPSLGQFLEPPYAFDPDAGEGGLAGSLHGR